MCTNNGTGAVGLEEAYQKYSLRKIGKKIFLAKIGAQPKQLCAKGRVLRWGDARHNQRRGHGRRRIHRCQKWAKAADWRCLRCTSPAPFTRRLGSTRPRRRPPRRAARSNEAWRSRPSSPRPARRSGRAAPPAPLPAIRRRARSTSQTGRSPADSGMRARPLHAADGNPDARQNIPVAVAVDSLGRLL